MDGEAKECPADAASACKRQKRTSSKDEGEYTTAATEETEADTPKLEGAAASAESKEDPNLIGKEKTETVNSHNKNNNNNRDNMCESEQKSDEPLKINDEAANTSAQCAGSDDEKTKREKLTSSHVLFSDDNLTDKKKPAVTEANAISVSPQSVPSMEATSCSTNTSAALTTNSLLSGILDDDTSSNDGDANNDDGNDHDGDDDDVDVTTLTFNRLRAQRTRFYRSTTSTNIESSSSSSSDNNNRTHSNSDESDTDLDEAVQQAGNAEDDGSRSPAHLQDDSSSDMSGAFWNRYYTTSNEENDSDDDFHGEVQIEIAVNKVLRKPKPVYKWNLTEELIRREHHLFNRIGWRGGQTSANSFGQGYYASRQVVERMKLTNSLKSHRSCVNCLSFNRNGDLICSGSDDLCIVVWDWASGKPRHTFKSGHILNIFQTKFIDSAGCLDIVSSSRDGQVRRAVIPPSGSSSIKPKRLYSHSDAVHKLVVVPQSRHEIISAGEDATIRHFDLRTNKATTLLRCTASEDNRRVRLFSISHHPYATEFCVSGSDEKLRVYDKRKLTGNPMHEMTPKDLKDIKITQITCAVYNYSGSEILASYSDAGIYLYDSRNYKEGEFLHSYEGHINSRTIKGVNFFGPRSEYVISGSDCGNIFFWDKNTEAVVNFVKGDYTGVVNCLEQHPYMPVLATSGLDLNVKIWTPSGQSDAEVPCMGELKETLQRNFRRNILELGDFDVNQIEYFIRHLIQPRRNAAAAAAASGRQEMRERNRNLFFNGSSNSSVSSSSVSSNSGNTESDAAATEQEQQAHDGGSSDEGNGDPLGCRTN